MTRVIIARRTAVGIRQLANDRNLRAQHCVQAPFTSAARRRSIDGDITQRPTEGACDADRHQGSQRPGHRRAAQHAERRLRKVARQVSDLARLEIEIFKERNPRVADSQVAECTLYLKGVTLRARDASPEMRHSLNLVVDELARQVKRHRDKLRHRREAHAAAARMARATV